MSDLTDHHRAAVLDEIWREIPIDGRHVPFSTALQGYDARVRARITDSKPGGLQFRVQAATSTALQLFGVAHQLGKLREECCELATAVCHYEQGRVGVDRLAEEVVGVRLTSIQAESFLGTGLIRVATEEQVTKLEGHIRRKRAEK